MINRLNSYTAIKDSGADGVGSVPSHWELRKLRNLLSQTALRNRSELPLLSVVRERGVIVRNLSEKEGNHNFIPDDLSKYKVVRAGQFVMNKMKAWQGSYGVSEQDGIVSPAYFTFDLHNVEAAFFHVAIRSIVYVNEFGRASDGVRVGQWDLSQSRMKEILVALPPPDEQAAIVRYVNYADRRIKKAIASKQRLINLLEKQRQSIVHRAVTRGLDPNVPMKPSGIEWLGDVPKHWMPRAFTRCAIERADYRGATPNKTESGVFLVTARNVRKGVIDYQISQEFIAAADYAAVMRRGLPKIGDVLLTMEAPLGNVALVDREDVAFAQRVIRFRLDERVLLPEFALNSMLSAYFQDQLLSRGTGSTALGIKASKLPQLQILCPPLSEQKQILDGIASEVRPTQNLIRQAAAEVAFLREYRVRLIADVVTGKVDVRYAAAHLSDSSESDVRDEDAIESGEEDLSEEDSTEATSA